MGKQPRYLEIARTLKTKIKQGVFPQGQSLPSQKELAGIFNTSIMTIRGALEELAQEGILTVVHGVGTFVAAPGPHTNSIGLQGFQNEMDRQKLSISNKVLSVTHDIRDAKLDQLFNKSLTTYSCMTRLRTIEGTPVILQRSYIECTHNTVLDTYNEHDSLYQYFSRHTGIMIIQGRELMTPILLEDREAELLGLKGKQSTAFLSKRISISLDEQIVLYDEAYLPGSYVFMASRKHGRTSVFKYIINKEGIIDTVNSFNDPELWEDLI